MLPFCVIMTIEVTRIRLIWASYTCVKWAICDLLLCEVGKLWAILVWSQQTASYTCVKWGSCELYLCEVGNLRVIHVWSGQASSYTCVKWWICELYLCLVGNLYELYLCEVGNLCDYTCVKWAICEVYLCEVCKLRVIPVLSGQSVRVIPVWSGQSASYTCVKWAICVSYTCVKWAICLHPSGPRYESGSSPYLYILISSYHICIASCHVSKPTATFWPTDIPSSETYGEIAHLVYSQYTSNLVDCERSKCAYLNHARLRSWTQPVRNKEQ